MRKVLMVEDDPMVAMFNKRYLEQIPGFTLEAIAKNANDALEVLSNKHIDLILLDIYMPGMNGLELLSHIRQTGKGVDVIIVSAACDSYSIKQGLLHGAIDYIIKPFEFARLYTALIQYKERNILLNDQKSMSQKELDECILHKETQTQPELPKGLDRNTLQKVWLAIQKVNGPFSTEQLAKSVGISRVSARKYLDFLQKIEVIRLDICYGAVGRPTYKYHCINYQANIESL